MATLEETRDRLIAELTKRRPDIDRLYAYYRGEHPLPWAPVEVREAYRAFLAMSRSNWCRLIVKAPSERLRVVGMKFADDGSGDAAAWKRYWQGNRLDLESRMVHDTALVARRGFALVWPNVDTSLAPTITPEHPSQVIVAYEPGSRRTRKYGLKHFADPVLKMQFVTLWTADEVASWKAPLTSGVSSKPQWQGWSDDEYGIEPRGPNPLGAVPLVEFLADPALTDEPMSELDGGVIDIQDRINKTILDRLVTSNFSSFRQKWVTGLEIPRDDKGNDIEPFKVAVNRLFAAEDPDVKFGEFGESSLEGYIGGVEADIQHLAAITRTPPHYLLGQAGAFPSGESLKATETGLVAKVLERRDSFTESWEDVMRLALRADGDSRADDLAMAMVWKDPESRSIAEVVDAATKLAAIGVPWRSVMEFVGYTPTEIETMDAQRGEDESTKLLSAVPPPTPAQPPPAASPAPPVKNAASEPQPPAGGAVAAA